MSNGCPSLKGRLSTSTTCPFLSFPVHPQIRGSSLPSQGSPVPLPMVELPPEVHPSESSHLVLSSRPWPNRPVSSKTRGPPAPLRSLPKFGPSPGALTDTSPTSPPPPSTFGSTPPPSLSPVSTPGGSRRSCLSLHLSRLSMTPSWWSLAPKPTYTSPLPPRSPTDRHGERFFPSGSPPSNPRPLCSSPQSQLNPRPYSRAREGKRVRSGKTKKCV